VLCERPEFRVRLDGLAVAKQFFAEWFGEADPARETLWVAHLDEHSDCIRLTRYDGDDCGVSLPIRSIIADAIRHGSAGMLIAHNHPSGDSRPSERDQRVTRLLAMVAQAFGCAVLDHLIFAGTECTSLRKMGFL